MTAYATGTPNGSEESPLIRKDGSVFWFDGTGLTR